MPSLEEVLRTLPRAQKTSTKTAASAPQTTADHVRAVAGALREIPEPAVSWGSLNAVKEAGFRSAPPSLPEPGPTPSEDTQPGADLRKLAQAVRTLEDQRALQVFEKSALALRAVRGLTLLRERTAL